MTIRELNISARSKSCLMSAGYKEVEDLRDVSDDTLSEIRNLNQECVAEIRKAVDDYFSKYDEIGIDYIDSVDDIDLRDNVDFDEDVFGGDIDEFAYSTDSDDTVVDNGADSPNAIEWDIDDLELSIRAYNCLKRAGINTVAELCERTLDDMMKVRNLGRRSLAEIIEKLRTLGLCLKDSELKIYEGVFATDIESLELSIRAYNCLRSAGIYTVGQLCERTFDDMMMVRNLGRKSLEEIISKMGELGVEFKDAPKIASLKTFDKSADLSTLIVNLDLSTRTKNWLRRRRVDIVKELCCMTEEQLDADKFLERSKNEIINQMNLMGVCFKPDEEESCLYIYPDHIKSIANEKDDAWEHRLFIESAIVYYEWLSQYRKQVPELWQYEDEDEIIDSRSKLVDLIQEKMEEIREYTEQIAECIRKDIVDSFGPPGEPGDVQQIIEATEKLMRIYKSIIRSRLSFRYIDAKNEYRKIISLMCEAYESLCKNIDVLYQKLRVAKIQLDKLVAGDISDEDVKIDLNITFELEMDELAAAIAELGEAEYDESDADFDDITILDSSTFRVDFCGIDFDIVDEVLKIKVWVKNKSGAPRKVWAKDVYVNEELVESIDYLGSVDNDDYGYAYEEITSVDGIDFEDYEKIRFTIEIDDMDNHEMEFSKIITVSVSPLDEELQVISVEDYAEGDDDDEETEQISSSVSEDEQGYVSGKKVNDSLESYMNLFDAYNKFKK